MTNAELLKSLSIKWNKGAYTVIYTKYRGVVTLVKILQHKGNIDYVMDFTVPVRDQFFYRKICKEEGVKP